MRKVMEVGLCGFIMALGLTGCLKNEKIDPQKLAGVSIYHSSPDAPNMNIIIDTEVITSQAFKYKNFSNYIEVTEGDHRIRFNRFNDGGHLLDSSFHFKVNKSYSLYVINTLAKIELLMREDVSDLPLSGNGRVRCLNLSPDAPKIDLRWISETSPLFTGLTFKQASDFKDVATNTYSLEVKMIGGGGRTVILSNIEIKEGGLYTVLVEGFDNLPVGNTNVFSARVISH